jgi:membrane-associated PAP2 superfamily phosphatase
MSYKKGLIIVCLSLVLVPLTVGALKAVTNIPCPKNITYYGGHYPCLKTTQRILSNNVL